MLDLIISRAVQSLNSDFFYEIMVFFTELGDVKTISVLLVFAAAVFWLKNRHKESILLASSVVFGAILGTLLKIAINRPRPTLDLVNVFVVENSQSFPSNHALVSMVFFGLLALFINKRLSTIFFSIIIFFVGLSRIFLGVHWASDVVAGYLIGALVIFFANKYYHHARG